MSFPSFLQAPETADKQSNSLAGVHFLFIGQLTTSLSA